MCSYEYIFVTACLSVYSLYWNQVEAVFINLHKLEFGGKYKTNLLHLIYFTL